MCPHPGSWSLAVAPLLGWWHKNHPPLIPKGEDTVIVIPSFPATPSKSWVPVKSSLFENLVGGSTPLPPAERGRVHTGKQLTIDTLDKVSITIMNNYGLSTEPWCTPTITLKGSLEEPFTCTLDCCTLLYIALTKRMTEPLLQVLLSSTIAPYKEL